MREEDRRQLASLNRQLERLALAAVLIVVTVVTAVVRGWL